ncbi:GerMN domain-containing protein [Amphibacillus xylanus]|uniref:Spore germination protein GerM n=1 Tax=Amphibacillus xylanus (strain ATCC 51415 / DSM 6626 / JCM 7361 / LMG 17667 / NBRC 15112 / Ep01) TaxID=698758 RepID=K0IXL9_AMPXN|nr:GerMN domain-containing protein [Amphibacillus xylanus]BAM47114.1 spore germination protein GerM [Amphibacillus xylanus NBRC 15112]
MNIRVLTKRTMQLLLIVATLFFVIGCNSSKEDDLEDMDAPQDLVEDELTEDSEEDASDLSAETVSRRLYLLSKEGVVVPHTFELPKLETNEVAAQAVEYLVEGGPITNLLPNGFEAVLPAGTEVLGLNLEEDGTLVVDLSEEFLEYDGSKEQQIIQAMTYTLTEFDSVERVKLWVNGFEQNSMPVNGTPIRDGYSRANGINILDTDAVDLINSEAVTIYYPAQMGANMYYVPVTQHIESDDLNRGIVEALLSGPTYESKLLHVFNPNIELIDVSVTDEGIMTIEFTEEILADVNEAYIADEVIETLVLTLTDLPDVNGVSISVENVEQIFNEHGIPYSEPVTRESFVPTGRF